MRPVSVEVIAYAPTSYYHCQHCELTFKEAGISRRIHQEQAAQALPADLQAEFQTLTEWLHRVLERYGDRIKVKLIDVASIEGFFKSLRYRVRRYPAVVIGRRDAFGGVDLEAVEPAIERHINAMD